jgi:alpha-L-rhamnosidase
LLTWALSFTIASGQETVTDAKQTAFRAVAAFTATELSAQNYSAWDSGWVSSTDSLSGVAYAGVGLSTVGSTVFWTVLVADGLGARCGPAPGIFMSITRAPADQAEFAPAQWISRSNDVPATVCDFYLEDPVPLLRTEFVLGKPSAPAAVIAAHLFISGLGFYRATINGQPVSDLVLDPAWTTYNKRTLFSAFNVTSLLRAGNNTIGVILGKGWYDPLPMQLFGSFDLRDALPVGPLRLIAQLVIVDGLGQRTVLGSDATWRVGSGSTRRNNIYIGVQEDARVAAAIAGWDLPGYTNASAWPPAVVTSPQFPIGRLQLQTAPGIRMTSTYAPTAIVPHPVLADSYTVHFPVNMAGLVALRGINAPAGWVTNMTFAEILFPDSGLINPVTNLAGGIGRWSPTMGGPCSPAVAYETDNVTWAGSGNESFAPSFTWHAFQYMQIDGWPTASHGPPDATNFEALQFNTDNGPAGNFASWNPQHTAIDGLARQSFRSNWAGGIQSDCPGRERLGYGGDLLVAADAAMMQFDLRTFYSKRVDDYSDAQQDNGGLPETAPFMGIETCDLLGNGTGPMQWGSGQSTVMLLLWERYGDLATLQRTYPAMQAWMRLLNSSVQADVGGGVLLQSGLADFTNTQADCPEGCTCPLMTVMGTAFLYQQARNAARIADILSLPADAAAYTAVAETTRSGFRASFVNASSGAIGAGGLDEQLWGLYLGLLDASDPAVFARAVQRVADAIVANGTHMYTGAFGTSFLFQAGPAWGLNDLILESLSQVDFPGYGFMLANGATALYEHWQALFELVSFNHAWLGSVAGYLRRYLGGVSYAQDGSTRGYDSLVIQPYPPSFNSTAAEAQVPGLPIPSRGGSAPTPGNASLPWANTTHTTARGPIAVLWAYVVSAGNPAHLAVPADGIAAAESTTVTMTLTVTLPGNAQATVYVPHPLPGAPVISRTACAAAKPITSANAAGKALRAARPQVLPALPGGTGADVRAAPPLRWVDADNTWDIYDLSYVAGTCSFTVSSAIGR